MTDLTNIVLGVIWFMLPAGMANIAPALFSKTKIFDTPVDLGKKFRGHRVFGSHKTYRGFVVGIIFAIITIYIQARIYNGPVALIDYKNVNLWLLGFLLGFGALAGDLIKSFFKRQKSISDGRSWPPFDQVDWILGALLAASFAVSLTLKSAIIAIILLGLLHPVVNLIGYGLGLKNNKY